MRNTREHNKEMHPKPSMSIWRKTEDHSHKAIYADIANKDQNKHTEYVCVCACTYIYTRI